MRSTGEVLGLADSFEMAFFKSQILTGQYPPLKGTVLITVASGDQPRALPAAQDFMDMGFKILATEGTAAFLKDNGIDCERINKLHEGRPHILDAMKNREIQLVLNTPIGKESAHEDSYIRKSAIKYKIPYFTTTAAGRAVAKGIKAAREGRVDVKSLQSYHKNVK
jgi:carbamoyl-phosphate synthase large subunit